MGKIYVVACFIKFDNVVQYNCKCLTVYGLGNASTAVAKATNRTSVTGYCPSLDDLRNLHHAIFARIKATPTNPPITPNKRNGISSKNIHGVLYST